jgi:hypothetical protein
MMYQSRLWMGQLSLCLLCLFFLSFFRTISAFPTPIPADPFSDSNRICDPFETPFDTSSGISSECEDSDINPVDDGPTSDRSPGIGVEFESGGLTFVNNKCNQKDTFDLKGYDIQGRSGTDWRLTVDTTSGMSGRLSGEYILNGKTIKIGSKRAGAAAEEVTKDFVRATPC